MGLFSNFFKRKNLADNKFLFEELLANTSDLIYFKDSDSRFIKASGQLARRLGASSVHELIGKTDFDFFSEEHAQQAFDDEKKIMETRKPIVGMIEKETFPDGRVLWSSTSKFPLIDKHKNVIGTVGISRDITARKKAEDELKASKKKLQHSLKEKEILLAEVHHRVKNNLAVISGMLDLQRYKVQENGQEFNALSSTQTRIKSIANVHELLYQTENFADINIQDLINKMVEDIQHSYNSEDKRIEFIVDIERIVLNPNSAVPFCLLMNELIQNSYSHAFKEVKKGRISISAKTSKGEVKVVYTDNGVGMPDDFEKIQEMEKSLGLTLIKALSSQLHAYNIKSSNKDGFTYQFKFNVDHQSSSGGIVNRVF